MMYDDTTKIARIYINGSEASYQSQVTGIGTKRDDSKTVGVSMVRLMM